MAISLRDERYRWLTLVLYAVAAFLVAVAIVFGARWIYRSIHDNNQPTVQQPVSTNQSPLQPATQTPSSSGQNNSGSQSTSQNSNSNLPNNGPGDSAALFISTSAAAAGLHYFIRGRKA